MSVPVQQDVPVPQRGRAPRYPLRTMDVGESFFVAGVTSAAMCAAVRRARDTGRTFTVRSVIEEEHLGGVEGVRCWRTS